MKNVVLSLIFLIAARISFAQPEPGTVLWTYVAQNLIQSSPVLAPDGTTYIVATGLEAITNNGSTASKKWSYPAGGTPAIALDGTIYSVGAGLSAINPDGSQKWYYPAGAYGNSGHAVIGRDNTIYFVGAGVLYSITPTGTKKWDYDIGGTSLVGVHSPVVSADGTIYVGLEDHVYAMSPYGTNKWTLNDRHWGGGPSCPAIAADGTVYFGINYLLAFSPDGNQRTLSGGFFSTSVIGGDGTIYVPDANRRLHALSPEGQIQWQVDLGRFATNFGMPAAAIDAGGRIYYCVSNSVWALNPQGQVLWRVTEPGDWGGFDLAGTSPTVGPDGTLYAAIGWTLYAIATGTNGPADSPWPMERQNARHTGKMEKPALRQPQRRSDANFQFQLYGQLGQTFTVEATTNFNTWTSVTNIVANTLPVDVVDLSASNHPSRFYRASSPP